MRTLSGLLLLLLPIAIDSGIASPEGSQPPGGRTDPDSLTVNECIEMARANAPDVRAAGADLEAARYDSSAASRNRRPAASFFGSVLLAPRGFYDPAYTNLGQYEVKAGITVPLFDGGAAARERARAANEAGLAAFRKGSASREAGLRAGQLAVDILARRERERRGVESLAWIEDLSNIIASRVRAGASSPADSMRITLERDAVEASLDSTRTGMRAARRELAVLLGMPVEALPSIRQPTPAMDVGPSQADSLTLLARAGGRPDVAIARGEEAQAGIDVGDVAHRKDLHVDLSADAGFTGTDLTALVPEEMRASDPDATFEDRLRRDLGASMTIDFRRGLIDPTLAPSVAARRSALDAARIRSANALGVQERASLDLLDRWRAAERAIDKSRSMVGRSELNLLRTKSLYIAGEAGILDILDARRTLDDAPERLIDAKSLSRLARIEAESVP